MGSDDHASLSLNLGFPSTTFAAHNTRKPTKYDSFHLNHSLTLSPSGDPFPASYAEASAVGGGAAYCTPSQSGLSSLSNSNGNLPKASSTVKREREPPASASEEVDAKRNLWRLAESGSDEDEELGPHSHSNVRKKLRLTKDQSALLESSFKHHTTLNPKQKQLLANQLNLRPRQVEVWFQNRRARTKLKQTELDCEFLKKCCETLTDENRRLQREIQELRGLKLAAQSPLYVQLPAATLTMCPSCERIGGPAAAAASGAGGRSKSPFAMRPKSYINPFASPSAAC